MAQIIGLFGSFAQNRSKRDWSNQDLAELYRVESALVQAGLRIDTERGVSDEGDPWFIFCHGDSGDVVAHFARIDGRYVIASPVLPKALRGSDLGAIVRTFVEDNPISLPSPENGRRGNVVFHPAALLTIFVATILIMISPEEGFASGMADDETGDLNHDHVAMPQAAKLFGASLLDEKDHRGESTYLVAAVALAIEVARFQFQDSQHQSGQLTSLDFSIGAQLAKLGDPGQDDPNIDLYGLSEFFFIRQQGAAAERSQFDPTAFEDSVHSLPMEIFVTTAEVQEIKMSAGGLQQLETHIVAEDDAFQVATSANPQLVVMTDDGEANGARTDPDISGATYASAAISWFEQKLSSDGWVVALIETSKVEALQAVEFVEGLGDTSSDVGYSAARASVESRDRVIEYFQASDTDIAVVEHDNGSLVMFDRSDVANGENLSLVSWVFDEDGTTLAILGHSSVINDAMALIA